MLHSNANKHCAAKCSTTGQPHKLNIDSKKQNTREQTQGDCSYVAQKAMLKQSWKRPRRGRGLAQCESLGLCPALLAPQTRRAKC